MADAKLERTQVSISVSAHPGEFLMAKGEVIKFDGFLKLYIENLDDEPEEEGAAILPPLKEGQPLDLNEMTGTERYTKPPARYTEAGLVKKLEELGIGRPSTYAPTISTIIKRNYVEKKDKEPVKRDFRILRLQNDEIKRITEQENTGAEKSKLFPTDLGLVVTDFLNEHFTKVMEYSFTASIEKEFDEIAEGKMKWNNMVKDFYTPFHEGVEHTLVNAERAVGERNLGTDPVSGKPIFARMGRYGPMVQIGSSDDEEKPRYAKLKPSQSIETISLEESLELFKLGEPIGEFEGQEISVNIGRFGPYVKFGDQFISIPRGEEPGNVTLNRAIELIQAKRIEDAPVAHYDNKPVTKGKGRFGPFIKWNDMFINVPVRYDFENLTQDAINELIEAKLKKEANRFIQQWPDEKLSLQNGRWGPEAVYGKKRLRLPKGKYNTETLATISLDEVKELILAQDPKAFDKKAPAKKKAAKKK